MQNVKKIRQKVFRYKFFVEKLCLELLVSSLFYEINVCIYKKTNRIKLCTIMCTDHVSKMELTVEITAVLNAK